MYILNIIRIFVELWKQNNNSDATNFIYAGNSIFTVLNSRTSNRFTFKVKKSKDGSLYFVSVLSDQNVIHILV
jgi:Zn/Cd-binding protein ZinT